MRPSFSLVRHGVVLVLLVGSALVLVGLALLLNPSAPEGAHLTYHLPNDAALDDRGRLLVSDSSGRRIVSVDPQGRTRWVRRASPDDRGFSQASEVETGPGGTIFVLDHQRNRITRWRPDGSFDRVILAPLDGTIRTESASPDGLVVVLQRGPTLHVLSLNSDGALDRVTTRAVPVGQNLVSAGPTGVVALDEGDDSLVRLEADGGVTRLKAPEAGWPGGLRVTSGGDILALWLPSGTWWNWKAGTTEAVLLLGPATSGGRWSPQVTESPGGALVFCDPDGGLVEISSGAWTSRHSTGAEGSLGSALQPGAATLSLSLGSLLLAGGAAMGSRRLIRRPADVQRASVLLLLAPFLWLTVSVQHLVAELVMNPADSRQKETLTEAALVASPWADRGDLLSVAALGRETGAFDAGRLLKPTASGYQVVEEFPHRANRLATVRASQLPSPLPGPGQVRVAVVDRPERQVLSAVLGLTGGGLLEVEHAQGVPELVADPQSQRLHALGIALTVVQLLGLVGLGAWVLASIQGRYTRARHLADPAWAPPPAAAGRRPEGVGVVLVATWDPSPNFGNRNWWKAAERWRNLESWAQAWGWTVGPLAEREVVVAGPAEPSGPWAALEAFAAGMGPQRMAVAWGSWRWTTRPMVDREIEVLTGPAVDEAATLAFWQPSERYALVFWAPDGPIGDQSWRPLGHCGGRVVAQGLSPRRPGDRPLLDYAALQREAFEGVGGPDPSRFAPAVAYLKSRLPHDPAVEALRRRLPS